MRASPRQCAQVAAAPVLLAAAIIALHGYVPAAHPPLTRPDPVGGPSGLLLLGVVGVFVGLAVFGARRRPRTELPVELDESGGRPNPAELRRLALLSLAAIGVLAVLGGAAELLPTASDRAPPAPQQAGTGPGTGADRPEPQPEPVPPGGALPGARGLVLATATMALLGLAVVAAGTRRGPAEPVPELPPEPAPEPAPTSLARAAELGLAEIAKRERTPRAAIIACYAAMERGLARSPDLAPLASDTPAEVLARAVRHGALHSAAAAALVDLFTEARFSPHTMTETQRDTAIALLRHVLADLRSPA